MGILSWKRKKGGGFKEFFYKNKRAVLLIGGVVLVLLVVMVLVVTLKKGAEKKVQVERQRVEESRQMRMSAASWSRVSFFESLPINVTFAMPDYLEGNYRLVKGPQQANFLYIKDPSNPVEMLYIKVIAGGDYQIGEGEAELSSDCQGYRFVYRLASSESYAGAEKEAFSQALYDIKHFLDNDGFFECRPRGQ
jgi:hypothetical protein